MGVIVLRLLVFVGVLVGALLAIRAIRPRAPRSNGHGQDAPRRPGDPYAVLGLEPDATIDEIRAAYRKALAQYHPDKVAELGPDLRKLATTRTQEIIEAYETLLKGRGA